MQRLLFTISLCVLLVLLAGCGQSGGVTQRQTAETATTSGKPVGRGLSAAADADIGRGYFHGEPEPDADGYIACKTCHYDDPEKDTLVGPNLAGIADHAASRVPEQSAEEYLHTSIIDHNAYIVDGFQDDVVLNVVGTEFGEILQPDDVDHLVAYLMTLEEGTVAPQDEESATATPTAEVAVELYVESDGYLAHDAGYTFQPPDGWQSVATANEQTIITHPANIDQRRGPVMVLRAGAPDNLNIPNESLTPITSTTYLFDILFASFEAEMFGVVLTDTLDMAIGGAPGRVARVAGVGLGDIEETVAGRLAMVHADNDDVLVILGLASPAAGWTDETTQVFDAVLASMRFDATAGASPYLHTSVHTSLYAPQSAATTTPAAAHHIAHSSHTAMMALRLQDDDDELRHKGPRFGCVSCHVVHEVEMDHDSNPSCATCHSGTSYQRHCIDCHSIHDVDITHEPNNPGCDTCHAQGLPGDGVSVQETLVTFMAYLFHDI